MAGMVESLQPNPFILQIQKLRPPNEVPSSLASSSHLVAGSGPGSGAVRSTVPLYLPTGLAGARNSIFLPMFMPLRSYFEFWLLGSVVWENTEKNLDVQGLRAATRRL